MALLSDLPQFQGGGTPPSSEPLPVFRADIATSFSLPDFFRTYDNAPWRIGTSAGLRAIQDGNGTWYEIDVSFKELRPSWFGAVGTANDDAVLTAFFAACTTYRIQATLDYGVVYTVTSTFHADLYTNMEFNSSRIELPNNGQPQSVIDVLSFPEDVTDYTLAQVNTWTNVKKGSLKIPELAIPVGGYGVCVTLGTTDKVFIPRADGSGGVYLGETFDVVGVDGSLADTLYEDWPVFPLTGLAVARAKIIRPPLTINGLDIRYTTGSGESNRCMIITRPNTIIKGAAIHVKSGLLDQGIVITHCSNCYINARIYGLWNTPATTNYGVNTGYSRRLRLDNCNFSKCRRGVDHHGGSDTLITGGSIQGHGGHWCRNLRVHGATIFQNPSTGRCLDMSGGDYEAVNCTWNLYGINTASANKGLFALRSDLPEFDGRFIIRGGTINIYDDKLDGSVVFQLLVLNIFGSFDYGRNIKTPSYIEFTPGIIHQHGVGDSLISICNLGSATTALAVPNNIVMGGRVLIEPGEIILDGPVTRAGQPKVSLSFIKGETQVGNYVNVLVKNISIPIFIFAAPQSAAVSGTAGRFDIRVENCKATTSIYHMRYGCVRKCGFVNCSSLSTLSRTGAVNPIGDEQVFPALKKFLPRADTTGTVTFTYGVDGTFFAWNATVTLTGNLTVTINDPTSEDMDDVVVKVRAPGSLGGHTFTVQNSSGSLVVQLTAGQTVDFVGALGNTWAKAGIKN